MKRTIILITIFFTTLLAYAQEETVYFEAKVSKNTLGVNERLRVDFVMNKDGDNFTPPSFSGFRVVGGPNQMVSHSWENGKRSFTKTYSYFLAPLQKGTFTIEQAVIEIDGKSYKTTPIKINVTDAVDTPDGDPNSDAILKDNLHLVAEVSNANPYLNQAISVVYKLYFSYNVNINDFRPIDNPTYNNFWSQDIDIKRLRIENGTYKGKPYRFVTLKQVVLYPQKAGTLTIEPLVLDVEVEVPTNRRDFFGGRIMARANKIVSAGKKTITVKPLPEKGKPDNFTGAVGDFTLRVTTSKDALKASESLQAKVEISGKGNLKLFEMPKITLPGSLEVYEPEFNQSISTNLSGMQGKVWDSYTIVPQYKGKYPIPSISFSYFDPKSETYKTLTSDEIILDVFEGPTAGTATPSSPNTSYKQPVIAGKQFKFLKLKPKLEPINKESFFGSTLYYALLLGPLVLLPIVFLVSKKRKEIERDVEGNKRRKANKLAKKYLSKAKKELGNKEAFYVALEKALHNYLKAKLHIETSDFTKEKIETLLTENKVDEKAVNEFIALLTSCEVARYTPSSNVAMQQDYQKAAHVISLIDKHI